MCGHEQPEGLRLLTATTRLRCMHACAGTITSHDPSPNPLPRNNGQKTCSHQQNVRLILTPPHQTFTQRAGERGQMCAKIITLRNQPKCTILDPKNSNNDSFGIHSVKVLVQVHYLILFRKRKNLWTYIYTRTKVCMC